MEGEMENFNGVKKVVPVELENEIDVFKESRCQVDLYAIGGKVDQGLWSCMGAGPTWGTASRTGTGWQGRPVWRM